jgi:tRNA dimethylallyltransferase
LELPRAVLYKQINQRVLQMVADGLVEEARKLIPFRSLNALQTVGYRELFDYFDGITSLDRAIELIQQNTRHYAKRQMTWFKKDPNIQWVDVGKREKALQQIIQQVIPM